MVSIRLSRAFAWIVAGAFALTACGGSGHSSSGPMPAASTSPGGIVPGSQPTIAPSPGGSTVTDPTAFVCPSSDTAAAVARSTAAGESAARRVPMRRAAAMTATAPAVGTRLLAVTYDARFAAAQRTTLAARESTLGGSLVKTYAFAHAGLVTHVLAVPAARADAIVAGMRAGAGVRAVGFTGTRRSPTSVNAPYFPNDPYFTGFQTTVPQSNGATPPPATYKAGPLEENADVPGQWDMHAIGLEYAFGYSQPGNGSNVPATAAALGSSAIKLAVIDTGVDATHPELQSKLAYQRCFITNPQTSVQSRSTFTTDPQGHGTNVAGIAGAAINNGLGFAGAGGNVAIYGYRVFPTPSDTCTDPSSNDAQCTTDTNDIADAITDAIDSHVNVIGMSLGGAACTTPGVDPDPVEGAAVADAIAANIIVVAAAGNDNGQPLEAPACDQGVIAVGATALADGQPNGSGTSSGSSTAPFEYVASYSDVGSPGASFGNASAWGIVAPGGDPNTSNDLDFLHWIDNIWTTQPYMANAGDTSFAGTCSGDYPTESGTNDCRVLIAGTSMSTPHVAGAAALILAVNPAYQSPTLMKQLLCTTADDIADPHEGCGRLDVYRAIATALHDNAPPPANPIP